jgi:hypothetical protein
LITFPFLIFLSVCLAKYSTYLDLLRKIAPERYRNHALLKGLIDSTPSTPMSRPKLVSTAPMLKHLMHEDGRLVSTAPMLSYTTNASSYDVAGHSVGHSVEQLDASVDSDDELAPYLDEVDTAFEELDTMLNQSTLERQEKDEFGLEMYSFTQHLDRTSLGNNVRAEPTATEKQATRIKALKAMKTVEDHLVSHSAAEIDKLDSTMRFYRRLAYGMAYFLLIGGLINALVFMGSMDIAIQVRYLKAVGQFLILSGIVTAPLILLWASGRQQFRMVRKRGSMTEEQWAGSMATATAIATAMVLTKAMIQREITRAIRESFDINII